MTQYHTINKESSAEEVKEVLIATEAGMQKEIISKIYGFALNCEALEEVNALYIRQGEIEKCMNADTIRITKRSFIVELLDLLESAREMGIS